MNTNVELGEFKCSIGKLRATTGNAKIEIKLIKIMVGLWDPPRCLKMLKLFSSQVIDLPLPWFTYQLRKIIKSKI